ncbi:MAG: nicotinate phosphoribosyltransferase [Gammaproteobacteria bacterium]|nr:nicotinate phosphoribosyltransferase [Gammaproteobacteria bacterium]
MARPAPPPLHTRAALPLAVDLYQLTMLQAYLHSGLGAEATFSLFFRKLPPGRSYAIACGQQEVAELLPTLRFESSALEALAGVPGLSPALLEWLADFRFSGTLRSVREGTPVFPQEPILEISGPLPEVQLLETLVMNQVHTQTVLATKAARLRQAAGPVPLVDFSMRRAHGIEASVRGVRAFHVGGLDATSNVLGGLSYGMPLSGTMAHSFIQAHDSELGAFEDFWATSPAPTFLIDTYDSLQGVDRVIELSRRLGRQPAAVRIDSGDLGAQAREVRRRLDAAGLDSVRIVVSGNLDEQAIAGLRAQEAPIDGFGVGTALGVSRDAPALDLVYKMVDYDGRPRAKRSPGKVQLPGAKQWWRRYDGDGRVLGDVLGLAADRAEGEPQLRARIVAGELLRDTLHTLDEAREHRARELAGLPAARIALEADEPALEAALTPALRALAERH